MGQVLTNSSGELSAYDVNGTLIPLEKNVGVKLGVGTYFFLLGGMDSLVHGAQFWWDANLQGVASIETCNLPEATSANPSGVSNFDTTGYWVHQDPSTAYVPAPSGSTVANATVTVTGGTANSTDWQLGNIGARRYRLKLVTTVAGYARVATHGKD